MQTFRLLDLEISRSRKGFTYAELVGALFITFTILSISDRATETGRAAGIRTLDLLDPNEALYQAEPQPDFFTDRG